MDRRRGGSVRPATSEEIECWSHATQALNRLNYAYTHPPTEIIQRVNRLISAWPPDDQLPAEGYEGVHKLSKKLIAGLSEIEKSADSETKAIDDAIESLQILIALRKAPAEILAQDLKRAKRRSSPAPVSTASSISNVDRQSTPSIQVPAATKPKILIPARPSGSSTPVLANNVAQISMGVDQKTRKGRYKDQLPYKVGRKVAYHIKASTSTHATAEDQAEWILAIIHDCISGDKNRYNVRDADDGKIYPTTTKSIIPLPDPEAKPGTPESLDRYTQFLPKSVVMALYPDTTSFYRAEVVEGLHPHPAPKGPPHYTLRFDDDDEAKQNVPAHLVVEWPKH